MKLKYQITCYREISQEELTYNGCGNITQYADFIQQSLASEGASIIEEIESAENIELILVQGIED